MAEHVPNSLNVGTPLNTNGVRGTVTAEKVIELVCVKLMTIKQAAKNLGISYSRAWQILNEYCQIAQTDSLERVKVWRELEVERLEAIASDTLGFLLDETKMLVTNPPENKDGAPDEHIRLRAIDQASKLYQSYLKISERKARLLGLDITSQAVTEDETSAIADVDLRALSDDELKASFADLYS